MAYPLPAAATDCPGPGIALTRLQGPPPGGQFPLGNTLVCHEAANQCGIRDTCCFTVTVQKAAVDETACDVKTPVGSCIKYEILSIRLDSPGVRGDARADPAQRGDAACTTMAPSR